MLGVLHEMDAPGLGTDLLRKRDKIIREDPVLLRLKKKIIKEKKTCIFPQLLLLMC